MENAWQKAECLRRKRLTHYLLFDQRWESARLTSRKKETRENISFGRHPIKVRCVRVRRGLPGKRPDGHQSRDRYGSKEPSERTGVKVSIISGHCPPGDIPQRTRREERWNAASVFLGSFSRWSFYLDDAIAYISRLGEINYGR